MSPIKRSNEAGSSHALAADDAGKRRRLLSTSSSNAFISSPVSAAGQSSDDDQNHIPPLWLQEPASSPLTNSFFDEFEMLVTPAFGQSGQAAPDFYTNSQGNSLEDILWSDDYETHEASRVDATLAEYQAILQNTDLAAPDSEYSHCQSLEDILWSDDYETHEASRVDATLAEYEAILLNKDLANPSVDQGHTHNNSTSLYAEQRSGKKSNYFSTSEQRQAILRIFKDHPERTNASIAGEFNLSCSTISNLRKQFSETGNLEPRERTKRLTPEERQAVLNIFKSNSERGNTSIATEFGFSPSAIGKLRGQFNKTGNIEPRELSKRLTSEELQIILNIFKNDPEQNNVSIANRFGVSYATVINLRKQFSETGNIKPREKSIYLTHEVRQAILNIFKNDAERGNTSIALEFSCSPSTISKLRERFNKTGNIDRRESSKRLTAEERQAILNIFKNNPIRSDASIAAEFGVSQPSISNLREWYNVTGNMKPVEKPKYLTPEERNSILNIFKHDSKRNNVSIADEFGIGLSTIAKLRNQFRETGNINRRESSQPLTSEQRQAILNVFKNDPKKSNNSIADEHGLDISTITRLKKQFREAGNLEPEK